MKSKVLIFEAGYLHDQLVSFSALARPASVQVPLSQNPAPLKTCRDDARIFGQKFFDVASIAHVSEMLEQDLCGAVVFVYVARRLLEALPRSTKVSIASQPLPENMEFAPLFAFVLAKLYDLQKTDMETYQETIFL